MLFGDTIYSNSNIAISAPRTTNEDYIDQLTHNINKIMKEAKDHQQKEITRRLKDSPEHNTKYNQGDLVLILYHSKSTSKLAAKWRGPYLILESLSEGNRYMVQHPITLKTKIVHIEETKKFYLREGENIDEIIAMDREESEIEQILDHNYMFHAKPRKIKKLEHYDFLVKFSNDDEPVWIPYGELQETQSLEIYLANHKILN